MPVQGASFEAVSAKERIVNLALHLTRYGSDGFATRQTILRDVHGYERYQGDDDKSVEAFRRTFENDKRTLREQGFVIEVSEDGDGYRIDMDRTFMSPLDLNPFEATALRAIGAAALADEAFPFKRDLRLGLAKIAGNLGWTDVTDVEEPQPLPSDEAPAAPAVDGVEQLLRDALARRKTVRFSYRSPGHEPAEHAVCLYGDFSHNGAWYAVGFDEGHGEVRTFRVERMSDVKVNTRNSKNPDYQIPADFKVSEYRVLPFQYGSDDIEGRFVITPEIAAFSSAIVRGKGTVEQLGDGSLAWTVPVRDCDRAASWCVETGPGVVPVAPPELVDAYRTVLLGAMGGEL